MSADDPISKLCPYPMDRATKRRNAVVDIMVRDIALRALAERPSANLLTEVYLAGLWHGAETVRQNPGLASGREVDWIRL